MTTLHIHQIYYSDDTRRALDPGFIPLDNLANERPDWREYWPIRKFLRTHDLRDEDLYGFLSPKFGAKGGLGAAAVKAFIEPRASEADIFIFSPLVELSAFFINLFEQGEAFNPGLIAASEEFFAAAGVTVDIPRLLTHSRNTIFCNYFVATGRFWREWFRLAERMFEICEGPDCGLKRRLNALTGHGREQVPMKVFVLERIATVLLCLDPALRARAYCAFDLPRSGAAGLSAFPDEAVVCDALKIAYETSRYPHYLEVFQRVRDDVFSRRAAARDSG